MNGKLKKRNVIYVCTSSKLWRGIATQLKKDYGFIPKFHVGFEKNQTNNSNDIFYGIPFYNINDARRGDIPQTIKDFEMGMHDINLFIELQDDFDTFLEMCERYIINTHDGTYEQKKNFFLHLIGIWTGIINHSKPEAVIIGSRPHRMFDLVLEFLCKKLNIPIVMLEETDMNNCVYAVDFRYGLSFPLDGTYLEKPTLLPSQKAKKYISDKQKSYEIGKPLAISLNGFFSQARQREQNNLFHKIKVKMPPSVILLWSIFKCCLKGNLLEPLPTMIKFSTKNRFDYKPITPTKFDLIIQTYKRQKQLKSAIIFYNKHAIKPDLTRKYVYFSASYQPERSTCPDAGRDHDMLLSLGALATTIDDDTIIYFKEHPRTLSLPADLDAQRTKWFYQEIVNKHPNVVFINNTYSPFELIDNAYFVAMTSGTSAVESVARGKYCIIFGDRWFKNFPGVLQCYSTDDINNAISLINTSEIKQQDMYQYLAEVEQYSDDISYLFNSNITFRKDIEKNLEVSISQNEQELINTNAIRAARQIYRAAGFN